MGHTTIKTDEDASYLKEVGERVAFLRGTMDLSMAKASEKANMGKSTIWRIEHGRRAMTILQLGALCSAFECCSEEILYCID